MPSFFKCFIIFQAGLEQQSLLASFVAFLFVALLNAYIYCYLGDELIVQVSSSKILWNVAVVQTMSHHCLYVPSLAPNSSVI